MIWRFAILAGLYLVDGLYSAVAMGFVMFWYHVIFHSIGVNRR